MIWMVLVDESSTVLYEIGIFIKVPFSAVMVLVGNRVCESSLKYHSLLSCHELVQFLKKYVIDNHTNYEKNEI